MPLDQPDLNERAATLNARSRGLGAEAVLRLALDDAGLERLALVSSFGAESVVLLHLVSRLVPDLPVLFLETGMLFPETLAYQSELAARLGLRDVRRITPDRTALLQRDADGILHQAAPDACCALRKTEPLAAALAGFDGWITGRKRFQGGARAALEMFEPDPECGRLKINPLAHWARADLQAYVRRNALPPHPLVARGFASVGCAPCTSKVLPGEAPRAGRWRDQDKVECGIHFGPGGVVRGSMQEAAA